MATDNSTLKTMDRLLKTDRETADKQREAADKGKGYPMAMSMDYNESLTIKKADAGGMILCWYGPNGSRDIIVKTAEEAVPLIERFFEDSGMDSKDAGASSDE